MPNWGDKLRKSGSTVCKVYEETEDAEEEDLLEQLIVVLLHAHIVIIHKILQYDR